MKDKNELLKDLKSHFNTKLIIVAFVAEFVMLAVLFCFAGRSSVQKEGSYALRDILSNAGAASSTQYSEIYSGATDDGELETFVSKYIAGDNMMMSSISPSLAGYINHEYNVKNYIQGKSTETETPVSDNKVPTDDKKDSVNYKYYQFVLNGDSYHSELLIDGADSVPAGVLIDQYSGKMIVKASEDFRYGPLLIQNPSKVPEFDLKEYLKTPLAIPMYEDNSPTVMLYYTHTSESYCVTENDKYALKQNNTDDSSKNVIACGNKITDILKNKYGVSVLNDITKNDVDYNNAYTASESLLKKKLAENPTVDLVVDIHRDSYNEGGKKSGPTVSCEGKSYAPITFVMGTGCYVDNDNREDNMKLAMLLIEKMEQKVPGITRYMTLRKDNYLSDYANKGLLVEIGFSGNYVTEAENTASVFAEALGEVYGHNAR
ncbi:MAG: hypothetical protein E7384_05670 [Ruminococcaceae bacterium]|nr:hypothetical protein [Oscillospiraceae bacterium]